MKLIKNISIDWFNSDLLIDSNNEPIYFVNVEHEDGTFSYGFYNIKKHALQVNVTMPEHPTSIEYDEITKYLNHCFLEFLESSLLEYRFLFLQQPLFYNQYKCNLNQLCSITIKIVLNLKVKHHP